MAHLIFQFFARSPTCQTSSSEQIYSAHTRYKLATQKSSAAVHSLLTCWLWHLQCADLAKHNALQALHA